MTPTLDCLQFAHNGRAGEIWRSTDRLAKGNHWSAAHAFPARKLESAALTIKPGGTGVSFFKLTWQGIVVPKNMICLSPGDFF